MKTPTDDERDELRREIGRCWPLAQEHWSRFLLLREPNEDPNQPSVAQIDLTSRQVSINTDLILAKDLGHTLEAILAHEVGHHVCFPGTMQTHARLRLLERSLLPFEDYSLINLFTDLMINERLGDRLREPLMNVYRGFTAESAFHAEARWKRDPAFLFYLAVYEEIWDQEPGALMGPAASAYGELFPAYRAEVRILSQNLFALGPNLYTQFVYFLSVMLRYLTLPDQDDPKAENLLQCGKGEPTPADWADAVTPSSAEIEAIRRALKEGWFEEDQADRLEKNGSAENRIAGLPGSGTQDVRGGAGDHGGVLSPAGRDPSLAAPAAASIGRVASSDDPGGLGGRRPDPRDRLDGDSLLARA